LIDGLIDIAFFVASLFIVSCPQQAELPACCAILPAHSQARHLSL